MSEYQTPRFSLPLLAVGQAHKELFHNEALLLLDFLIDSVVLDVSDDPASLSPAEGDYWLIGPVATAEWSGKSDEIAGWSNGGWHYIKPQESMKIIMSNNQGMAIYHDASWQFIVQVNGPAGGTIIDSEARSAIDSILDALRTARILPHIN
ncbi:MAG: DUF2793 domain-containing protein [Parasphingorhabdus sp.]|uniref:DUF2793 domain-containing protein n=1 Tax=Parasphingorhabdus sp. TaxID=2709688 RepID=UPI003002C00D